MKAPMIARSIGARLWMTRSKASAGAAVMVLVLPVVVASCWGVDTSAHLDLERMTVQPRYQPFGKSSFFEDERMMRTPPAGTVPAEGGSMTVGATGVPGAVVDGIYRDRVPIPVTAALARTGRRRFETVCAPCHGLLGDGDGPVARHMVLRRPPSLLTDTMRATPAGRFYRTIEEGYGLMPSYASLLSPEERWAVVAYLDALRLSQSVPLAELPVSVAAEARGVLGASIP